MLGKVPPFAVGYSLDDVVFAWTGHGVNTDRDMKLSQFDLIRTPTGNGTKNQNKSEFIGYSFYIKSVSRLQPRSSPFIFGGGAVPASWPRLRECRLWSPTYTRFTQPTTFNLCISARWRTEVNLWVVYLPARPSASVFVLLHGFDVSRSALNPSADQFTVKLVQG